MSMIGGNRAEALMAIEARADRFDALRMDDLKKADDLEQEAIKVVEMAQCKAEILRQAADRWRKPDRAYVIRLTVDTRAKLKDMDDYRGYLLRDSYGR